jgi:Protein of unknown function (DUF1365)
VPARDGEAWIPAAGDQLRGRTCIYGLGLIALDGVVFLSCLGLSYVLYSSRPHDLKTSPRAYVLRSIATDSRHAFTYPVLSLILPLSALESARLSLLNGTLFSYGGTYGRIFGLRSASYLFDEGGKVPSIRTRLIKALDDFGVGYAEEQLDDAWILTMPSYYGFEGLNPLTVYFCYREDNRRLWIVVLEVRIQRASPMFEASSCMTLQFTIPLANAMSMSLKLAPNAK